MKPTFIAEIGINHHGDMEKAFRMIDKAIQAGATYIKGQYYDPIAVLGKTHPDLQYAMKCRLSKGQHEALAGFAALHGGRYFVSVFNTQDVKWSSQFGVMKVASRMNKNQEFLAHVDKCKLPTFMSVQPELTIKKAYNKRFSLLWCVRKYPTSKEEILEYPYQGFGLSSHCPDPSATFGAYQLGARVFENHLVEAKDELGCDVPASIDFKEYKQLIRDCK